MSVEDLAMFYSQATGCRDMSSCQVRLVIGEGIIIRMVFDYVMLSGE